MPMRTMCLWTALTASALALAASLAPNWVSAPIPQYCYIPNPTDDQAVEITESTGWLNPAQLNLDDRYALDATAWSGVSQLGDDAQAQPASVTYSFPSGAAPWGDPCCFQEPNQLDGLLEQMFGTGNLDLGREYIRQSLASWTSVTGLSLHEAPDDDAPLSINSTPSADRGDVRIGANTQQSCTRRAATFFPVHGGDIFFNAGAFFPGECDNGLGLPDLDFLNLRNVTAHEFGHAIGFFHSTPCNGTKLLEPSVDQGIEFVQVDDIRGAQRNYGDRLATNQSAATAHHFGDLTSPIERAVYEPNLSTNGLGGPFSTSLDWFGFSLGSAREVTLRMIPKGGAYPAAQQFFACEPATPGIVNAQEAGDLRIELYESDGTSLIMFEGSGGPGETETLVVMLEAGDYRVRVPETMANIAQNQFVQLYDLEIRPTGALAPPRAVAGLDKRILRNQACFFIGDMLSRTLEPGAMLDTSSFDWDLDGDEVFETMGDPRPITNYSQAGVVPVTLRVTDSNGMASTHTIEVTIAEPPSIAPLAFDLTSPTDDASLGDVGPTLEWESAQWAESYTLTLEVDQDDDGVFEMIVLEQAGIADTSLALAPGALNYKLSYRWSVDAENEFGTTTSSSIFTFRTPLCLGDANYDKTVNFADITSVLNRWLMMYLPSRSGIGDSNNSGSVDFSDITSVLNKWLETCP